MGREGQYARETGEVGWDLEGLSKEIEFNSTCNEKPLKFVKLTCAEMRETWMCIP